MGMRGCGRRFRLYGKRWAERDDPNLLISHANSSPQVLLTSQSTFPLSFRCSSFLSPSVSLFYLLTTPHAAAHFSAFFSPLLFCRGLCVPTPDTGKNHSTPYLPCKTCPYRRHRHRHDHDHHHHHHRSSLHADVDVRKLPGHRMRGLTITRTSPRNPDDFPFVQLLLLGE